MSSSLDATQTGELTPPIMPSSAIPVASAASQRFAALRYCAVIYLAVRAALFLLSATARGLSGHSELTGRSGAAALVHNGWSSASLAIVGWLFLTTLKVI